VAHNRNRGGESGNLTLIRGHAATFVRIEDPELDDLPETFIDRYRDWGRSVTDAPQQYHTLAAAVILSTIICPYTTLRTSFGEIRPNIWAMILAGTTITRKSTSMDMAKRLLTDSGLDYLMGTDGSPEGILSEMSDRDGKVSLFHRDEITGWIEQMRKDYMSGLLESFTRMYDGMEEMRVLRSGKIEVKKPRLVILSGGIKDRMQEICTMDHIRSGFLPRFIFISGSTNPDQMRVIGPPLPDSTGADPRDAILAEVQDIAAYWIQQPSTQTITIAGMTKKVTKQPEPRTMTATPDAWTRIQQLQDDATRLGEGTTTPNLYTPILTRLSNSVIKIAMLLSGARKSTVVEYIDVVTAIRYSNEWVRTAMEFARGIEVTPDLNPWEKKAIKIVKYIKDNGGASRSEIMRRFHVKSKDIQDIEQTLVARGNIKIVTLAGQGATKKSRVEYRFVNDEDEAYPSNTKEEDDHRVQLRRIPGPEAPTS